MKRKLMLIALAVAIHAALVPTAHADSWTFTLDPVGGSISGSAGSTIGWGYTITNSSTTNWLMLSGLSADAFQHATPDASLFLFPVVAPMSSLTVTYNASTFEGLFQITWDSTAPVGFVNGGTFVLSAEFWDADPFSGGNFASFALDQSALYSATVTPGGVTPVPEPASLILFSSGLCAVAWRVRGLSKRP